MPPLRDRKEDIPLLVRSFLRHFSKTNEKKATELTGDAMNALLVYDWPGNVRELRTAIEHGVVMATGPKITIRDLPAAVRQAAGTTLPRGISPAKAYGRKIQPARHSETEKKLIMQALAATSGNVTAAAQKLGISRRTLHRKINEMNKRSNPPPAQRLDNQPRHGMPGSADFIQRTVHELETGAAVVWLRRGLVVLGIAAFAAIYFTQEFRGLATSQAMDQAQIGREIARGHLWQTKFARPRSIGQFLGHGKNVPQKIWYDTYNAPLPPLVDAVALFPIKSQLKMTAAGSVTYIGDQAIALMAILLFLLSVVILFLVARRLFDQRLALDGLRSGVALRHVLAVLALGPAANAVAFFFNGTLYLLVRAVEAHYDGGRVGAWLALVGLGFGLLALGSCPNDLDVPGRSHLFRFSFST